MLPIVNFLVLELESWLEDRLIEVKPEKLPKELEVEEDVVPVPEDVPVDVAAVPVPEVFI